MGTDVRWEDPGERDSARIYEVTLAERHLWMPNIGSVRLKEGRSERGFQGRVLSATIRRRAGRWFVSLTVEREREILLPKPVKKPSDVVGVDLGLKAAAVSSDGVATRVVEPQQAGPGSTTRSPAGGRTCSTNSRAHRREPSR